jgi:hypothetical protein
MAMVAEMASQRAAPGRLPKAFDIAKRMDARRGRAGVDVMATRCRSGSRQKQDCNEGAWSLHDSSLGLAVRHENAACGGGEPREAGKTLLRRVGICFTVPAPKQAVCGVGNH